MFYIEEFLKHLKEKQYSFSTLRAYRKDLEHFEAYFTCHGIEDVRNISKHKVLDYLNTLNRKAHPNKAYCNQITRIIKYFRYLEEEGLIVSSQFFMGKGIIYFVIDIDDSLLFSAIMFESGGILNNRFMRSRK